MTGKDRVARKSGAIATRAAHVRACACMCVHVCGPGKGFPVIPVISCHWGGRAPVISCHPPVIVL